jgi:hypothetical protein
MRNLINSGLLFVLLFSFVFLQACWLSGVNYSSLSFYVLELPLLAGLIIGGISSVCFFIASYWSGSTLNIFTVSLSSVLLFVLLNVSNRLFLPGFWPPVIFVAVAAFILGLKWPWLRSSRSRS